jgi:CheY-like chemotaxis protein
MYILVVDDQPEIRTMFTVLLEDDGYSVATAANGREALDYLRRSAELPSLILLDIAMPVMTGWDFLREQQSDAALATIPVILMTARGHFDNQGRDIYATEYIHKPTELETLLATVRHYCTMSAEVGAKS